MTGPSFRFRLERVRALRETREDEAKAKLAGAMARRNECEQQLHEAAERVTEARSAQLASETSSASDLQARQAYLERHEQNVVGRRTELTEAARDRQALERLKQHQLADHQREAARREGAALDEIAINGFRRREAA